MEPAPIGLILKQMQTAHGETEMGLSVVTIVELTHGIQRAPMLFTYHWHGFVGRSSWTAPDPLVRPGPAWTSARGPEVHPTKTK